MPAPTLLTSPSLTLTLEPFTREAFAPFGTAIIPPLPRNVTAPPDPLSSHPKYDLIPTPVPANQGSALKYSPVSPFLNNYPSQCPSGKPSSASMNLFSCFPRPLRSVPSSTTPGNTAATQVFDVRILERHPYTTQTFTPLGLSSESTGNEAETYYLVIVAPTLKGQTAAATTDAGEAVTVRDPPDLGALRAFVVSGGQAVTYGAGTWHAPMVVLGKRRVDFVIVQFVNGVDEEDCQEVKFGEGIVVDVGGSGEGGREVKI